MSEQKLSVENRLKIDGLLMDYIWAKPVSPTNRSRLCSGSISTEVARSPSVRRTQATLTAQPPFTVRPNLPAPEPGSDARDLIGTRLRISVASPRRKRKDASASRSFQQGRDRLPVNMQCEE